MVLQSIRERLSGIMAVFILVLLAIPFAFVGVNSYFQSGTENLVALVNDEEITFNEFNQSFLNYRRQMQSYLGEAYDPDQFDGLAARREHLDRMIDERLLEDAAARMGLDVDDERLAERIRGIPAFQVDGEFNPEVYQARLLGQGLTAKQFENDLRTSIILGQLPGALSASSFATRGEVQDFISLQAQTRSFDAVVVARDEESAPTEFSAEAVQAYYEKNAQDFRTEEQVLIEYIELDAATLDSPAEPDEEELRARFEEQKGRFITPEQRLVSHVLIEVDPEADEATIQTARQQAADLAARARAGEDFAALAEEFSDDAGSAVAGGDLGWVAPGFMVSAFEDAMYELTLENPVSDPVQTGFGWHVILLRDIRESEGQSFEEARETLLAEYHEEESERLFLDLADRLVDIVYEDPTTLEAASLDTGLPIQTAGPFSRQGGEGIAANAEVVEAAFSDLVLLQDSVSDPIDLGPNHMVMLRAREHLPSAVRPLEEVREDIVAALRSEAADLAAKQRADALLAEVNAGRALAEVATEAGLEPVSVEDAARAHNEPDPLVVTGVFRLAPPAEDATHAAVVEAGNGYAVVVLRSVTPGALNEDSLIGREQYRRQIANAAASHEAWALRRQLQESADITVYEDNLGVSR